MKRLMLALAPLLLVGLLAPADAFACNRCGLFGRLCRFNSHAHVAVVDSYAAGYAAPSSIQTFNFVNSGTLPLSAQSQTVYGYSLAAQAYAVDPAAVLSQAARLTSNAQALASDGFAGFNVTAQSQLSGQVEVAKILAAGQANAAAILASRGDQQPAVHNFSFRATVENGQMKVERIDGDAAVRGFTLPQDSASLAAVVTAKCSKCHSGPAPKGGLDLTLIGNADATGLKSILERIESPDPAKRMPKGGPTLTMEEKSSFYSRYEQLRGRDGR